MGLAIVKSGSEYLALVSNVNDEEWELVSSIPMDASRLAKLLAECGWHQTDIWVAFGVADPQRFPTAVSE